MIDFDWDSLGRFAPEKLVEPRIVLHHASQLAAAAGASLLPPRPDDSHPNLAWESSAEALAGHPIEVAGFVRAALRPRSLSLLVLDGPGQVLETVDLPRLTVASALQQLGSAIERAAGHSIAHALSLPAYELPHHAVATGKIGRAHV